MFLVTTDSLPKLQGVNMSHSISELNIELARVNAQIAMAKAMEKLQNCKLSARTADKYFALQTAYLHACQKHLNILANSI
jgi:hypothetical protein